MVFEFVASRGMARDSMSKHAVQATGVDVRARWRAFTVLCLGALMTSINAMSVNVALPSIRLDLHFTEASLVWVTNAYVAASGGFLLLVGRLGDLFGRRQLFLVGITIFTLASLGCGLATSPGLLVAARFGQGLGGAIVWSMALSQIMNLFTEAPKRAKALGIYVFVIAGGNSIGLLLGGILTSALSWHWIFLVHVPIGAVVCAMCIALLPHGGGTPTRGRLDVAGAVTITTSLMLAVYAIVSGNQAGWSSAQTLTLLGGAGALLILFVGIEARAQTPLIPLELFRIRNLKVVTIGAMLLAAAMLTWNYVSALYLQLVLQLSPFQVGLAFLPANLTSAVMALVVSPPLVVRLGIKRPLVAGMLIAGIGLSLLARAPVSGNVVGDVIPGMVLLGLGSGVAYHPLLLCALCSVAPYNSGVASGIINTSLMMGGALGLSILVRIAAARTEHLLVSGASVPYALSSGYQIAFSVAAVFVALAALICGVFLRNEQQVDVAIENIGTGIARGICDDTH